MSLEPERRYLCSMKGKVLYVHGIAHLDELARARFLYKWTCAITESYMQSLIDAKNIKIIWYQKEFDFDC